MSAAEAKSPAPIIERYGPGGFQIGGVVFTGPVLVFADRAVAWEPPGLDGLTAEHLKLVVEHGDVEVLLLGTGPTLRLPPNSVRGTLRAAGIVVEPMDTAAACRTLGVMMAERRRVAAALLPIRG